jgi:pimeloyl-ACP methyl ester carboxylesterase
MVALPIWLVPDPVPDPVRRPDGRLGPPVPLGRRIWLADRGTTFVRELEGPPGTPTVLRLHGWIASAGLNWFRVFAPLSEHLRVVPLDHEGRSCAD